MTAERRKKILVGILDLMSEHKAGRLDVVFDEAGYAIHIDLEEIDHAKKDSNRSIYDQIREIKDGR